MMTDARERRRATALVVSCVLLALLVRTAWVSDDAYVTFRTIDNWLHGFGLRWNPLERVQAFTHPLWLLLVAAGYAITGEPYYAALALSIVLGVATGFLLVNAIARETATAIGAAAILLLSKSFVDFSTSGLENPLTHLLSALFFAAWFDVAGRARVSRLAWLAGLLAVTHAAAVLLVLPTLVAAARRDRSGGSATRLLPAVVPFLVWSIFATVYYGFPAPNPTYSWAAAASPPANLIRGGMVYLLDSMSLDPLTGASIIAVVALAAVGAIEGARPLAAGIVCYVSVAFVTGGDLMSGRLLSAPLLCAAIAASRVDLSKANTAVRLQLLALIVGLGLMSPGPTITSSGRSPAAPRLNESTGIADTRLLTYPASGLLTAVRGNSWPNEAAMRGGHAARDAHRQVVTSSGDLIAAAFFAGPTVHIVDATGDADPLLARLPPKPSLYPDPAIRELPDGYEDAAISGAARLADLAMAAYYEQLTLITRGPIWSVTRWQAIVRMNLTRDSGRPALGAP